MERPTPRNAQKAPDIFTSLENFFAKQRDLPSPCLRGKTWISLPESLRIPLFANIRMPEIPATQQLQKRLAELLAEARELDLSKLSASDPARLLLLLAARFDYDVRQGGFAQLLYNLNGDFLAEVEDMLVAAAARIAREYYVRAIRACLANQPEYQRFLVSDYLDSNAVRDALHEISIEYFAEDVSFATEAEAFLAAGGK